MILSATTKSTQKPTAKPTTKTTPKPSAEESGEISTPEPKSGKQKIMAGTLVSLGVIFIGAAIFPFVRQEYEKNKQQDKENS
jgi:uncharacterized protein HemX